MKNGICGVLLLLGCASAHAQEMLRRMELSVAAGGSANTALRTSDGAGYGDRMLLSRSFVAHYLRNLTRDFSLGLRGELVRWRNEEQVRYTDTITKAAGNAALIHNLGRDNFTLSLAGKWRPRKSPLTLGAYFGWALSFGEEQVNNGLYGGGEAVRSIRPGFATGVEGGLRLPLSKAVAVELLGAVQYVRVHTRSEASGFLFAFPVTAGVAIAVGDWARFRPVNQEPRRADVAEQVERLKDRRDRGEISQQEYEAARAKVLRQ